MSAPTEQVNLDLADDNQDSTNTEPQIIDPRGIALDLLEQVLLRRQPLDQVLSRDTKMSQLDPRDRAFTRMVLMTTLRRLGQIDALILAATEKETPPSPPLLHLILRLGIAQLCFMDVADHAAVDTTVNLAAARGMSRQRGFVNAVMRRLSRESADRIAGQEAPRLNTPEWLLTQWIKDYGFKGASDIALANLSQAPVDFTVKDVSASGSLASMLDAVKLPTGSLRRAEGGRIDTLPGYQEGQWWVQDISASLPVKLLGDLNDLDVLDICAAPGGKTAQLAVSDAASVTALDISARRMQRLKENLTRLGLETRVQTVIADAGSWRAPIDYDAILLDAPCTASGTIRRHPDMPHLKGLSDQERLMALQAKLLNRVVDLLKPGGRLIYCTCSLQKAEGEAQIDAFLKANPQMARLPVARSEVGHIDGIVTASGDVRILPYHLAAQGGMDGFYIARLTKAA